MNKKKFIKPKDIGIIIDEEGVAVSYKIVFPSLKKKKKEKKKK